MIRLSDHFTYLKLLKFTIPSIFMLIFTSIYGIVDGFFVSNFVGKLPFTALNFIMPFLILLSCFGFLFGTGGGALIAKTLGEGNKIKANRIFSMLVYISILCGIVFAVIGFILLPEVSKFLGAEGDLLAKSVIYSRIVILALPMTILQFEFQCIFPTAEKPKLGLYVTIAAGLTNILLDALLIVAFDLGLVGAAVATVVSEFIGGFLPIIYFSRKNSSLLRLTKTTFDFSALIKTCSNGISEVMDSVSISIVGMLYNVQLLKFVGEDGVAAYGIIMYVNLIFQSIFIGYSVGTSPIVSYHFGAKNSKELKNLMKKSFAIISISAISMFLSAEIFSRPLAMIFVSYDENLLNLTIHAFRIYSFSFFLSGFTLFISAFFTALNDGITSAIISFLHLMIFETSAVLILPHIFGVNGIWISVTVAEVFAVTISTIFLMNNRRKYKYF